MAATTNRSAVADARAGERPADLADDAAAIAGHLRLSATRLARQLRQQADSGKSPSQLSALASVYRHGPLTLGELSARERVAPPSVTRVVAKLEEEGLVERQVDPTDRRVSRVSITTDGAALVDASRRRKDAWLTGRIDGLDIDQRARLAAALDVLDLLIEDEP